MKNKIMSAFIVAGLVGTCSVANAKDPNGMLEQVLVHLPLKQVFLTLLVLHQLMRMIPDLNFLAVTK